MQFSVLLFKMQIMNVEIMDSCSEDLSISCDSCSLDVRLDKIFDLSRNT